MEKYQKYFTLATLVLCLFTFLRTCGTALELTRIEKNMNKLQNQVRVMDSTSIKSEQMVKILEETTLWETLVIEELSDKQQMPINHYKNNPNK